MKKILQIKWENILVIEYIVFYIIKTIKHIKNYGLDIESQMTMFVIFTILIFIIYMLTLSLRQVLLKEVKKNE